MGVRASIWSNDFIVGAGVPGGVSEPWAKIDNVDVNNKVHINAQMQRHLFISGWRFPALYRKFGPFAILLV